MSAKIIDLSQFRLGVRACNGVQFPQVYQLDGFCWKLDEQEMLIPGDKQLSPLYTLNNEDDAGYANPTWIPITTINKGWLIIRHHVCDGFVEGYLDAMMDMERDRKHTGRMVYRTKEGLFTLLYREPIADAPDGLIIYITKMQAISDSLDEPWVDTCHIIHNDGSVSHNIDTIFYPHLEDEE